MERSLVDQQAHVPAHFDFEVLAALRRMLFGGAIGESQAEGGLAATARLPALRTPLAPLLAEAYGLRSVFSAGDVFYVVLARRLSATLVTLDAPLARTAASYVEVSLIEEPTGSSPPS